MLWHYHVPQVNNQCKTSQQDTKISTMFLLSVAEKFIYRPETEMTDVVPSIVGQYVRPLKKVVSRVEVT